MSSKLLCCFRSYSGKKAKRVARTQQPIALHIKCEDVKNENIKLPKKNEIWKHVKTNRLYIIHEVGKLQTKVEQLDMQPCAIYSLQSDRGATTEFWIRPLCDFVDTINNLPRFVKMPSYHPHIELDTMPANKILNHVVKVKIDEDDDDDWDLTQAYPSLPDVKKSE